MNENTEIVPVFQSDSNLPVVSLHTQLSAYGLLAPKVPAKELIGREFVIKHAKPFDSSYAADKHAYFCVCADLHTGEQFSTVLGGETIVEQIDLLRSLGLQNPVSVKLNYLEQGKFSGYYVFEPASVTPDEPPF